MKSNWMLAVAFCACSILFFILGLKTGREGRSPELPSDNTVIHMPTALPTPSVAKREKEGVDGPVRFFETVAGSYARQHALWEHLNRNAAQFGHAHALDDTFREIADGKLDTQDVKLFYEWIGGNAADSFIESLKTGKRTIPSSQREFVGGFFAAWASDDPSGCVQFFRTEAPTMEVFNGLLAASSTNVCDALVSSNSYELKNLLLQYPTLEAYARVKQAYLDLSATGGVAAARNIRTIDYSSDPKARSEVSSKLAPLLDRAAFLGPKESEEAFSLILNSQLQNIPEAILPTSTQFGKANPEAVVKSIIELPGGEARGIALNGALSGWIMTDPDAALHSLKTLPLSLAEQKNAVMGIYSASVGRDDALADECRALLSEMGVSLPVIAIE